MQAADMGNVKLVQLLVDRGADVNLRNRHGHTALMKAACKGKTKVVKLLVQVTDPDIDLFAQDASGKSALDWARLSDHYAATVALEESMLAKLVKQRELQYGTEKLRELAAAGIQLAEDNRKLQPVVRHALSEAVQVGR